MPRSRAPLADPTGMVNLSSGTPQGFLDWGIPRVRSSRASKGGEHPRVVLGQPNFSIKAPKECSKKFAANFTGKFLTRGNVLRLFFLFLEDFWAGSSDILYFSPFSKGGG